MFKSMLNLLFPCLFFLGLCVAVANAQNEPVAGLPDGIVLPRSGVVFVLDQKGEHPTLVQLHPSEVSSNSHAAGNFARSMVYAGAHASIELKGLNAPVGLANDHAAFYVRINGEDPELMRTRVHLIRLEQSKSTRVVSVFSQNVFGGQRQKKYEDIAVTKSDADPDVWLKVTPEKPLAPGEYGIVFMPKDPNFAPDVVYDFDVAVDAAKPDKK